MVCKKCGNFINDDVKFCPYCGSVQSVFADLVQRAMAGDGKAKDELYARTIEKVYFAVKVLIRDDHEANGIINDAYMKGYEKLHQLKDADNYQAWMKRIAHNMAVDRLRSHKVVFMDDLSFSEQVEIQERMEERVEYLPEEAADQRETARLLNEILDSLPEDQRAVLCMYYYDQMSSHEIAEELGININTVKSRLIYARKKVEIKVRELESKGTKLYSLAPIPFFIALIHTAEKTATEIPGAAVFQAIKAGTASAAVSEIASVGSGEILSESGKEVTRQTTSRAVEEAARTGAKKVAKESAKATARSAGKAAASGAIKAGAGAAAKGGVLKGIAVALAVTTAGGGAVAGVKLGDQYFEKKQEEILLEEQRLAALSVTPTPTPIPEPTPTPEPTPEELAEMAKARDLQLYQGILDRFKAAKYEQGSPQYQDQWVMAGLSELIYISYADKLVPTAGYTLLDIDKNGVYELALLDTEEDLGWGGEFDYLNMDRESGSGIYCLYTLKDGNPVMLAQSDFRTRYHLLENGYIFDFSNSGMINVSRDFLRINDSSDGLESIEYIHYSGAGEAADNPNLSWTYSKMGDSESRYISEEQAYEIQRKYRPAKLNIIPLYN